MAYRARVALRRPTSTCIHSPINPYRTFSTTTSNHSALFQLGALSNSRETSYFTKYSGLSRIEHSPNLALIRSSEVKPMEKTKKNVNMLAKLGGGKRMSPVTKVVMNKGNIATAPDASTTTPAKHIVRTVGRSGRMYDMRLRSSVSERAANENGESNARHESIKAKQQTAPPQHDPSSALLDTLKPRNTPPPVPTPQITPQTATEPAPARLSHKSLKALALGRHILRTQLKTRQRLRNQLRQRIALHRADKRAFFDEHYRLTRASMSAYLVSMVAVALSAAVVVMAWTNPLWVAEKKQIWDLGGQKSREVLGGFLDLGSIWGTRSRAVQEVRADRSAASQAVVDDAGKVVAVQTRPAPKYEDVVRGPAKTASVNTRLVNGRDDEGWTVSLSNLFWSSSR